MSEQEKEQAQVTGSQSAEAQTQMPEKQGQMSETQPRMTGTQMQMTEAQTRMTETQAQAAEIQAQALEAQKTAGTENAGSETAPDRQERDAGAMARERLMEKKEEGTGAAPSGGVAAGGDAQPSAMGSAAVSGQAEETPAEQAQKVDRGQARREAKEARERAKREEKEAKARAKQEAEEAKARAKREAQEEKERSKQQAKEERQQQKSDKKARKTAARQERVQELKSIVRTAEFVMLVVFLILAIDQAGLYGFLFVWLFIAVLAASVAVFFLGIVRKVRKKRSGIVFFVSILGMLLCTAWLLFLYFSHAFGIGPVPN